MPNHIPSKDFAWPGALLPETQRDYVNQLRRERDELLAVLEAVCEFFEAGERMPECGRDAIALLARIKGTGVPR